MGKPLWFAGQGPGSCATSDGYQVEMGPCCGCDGGLGCDMQLAGIAVAAPVGALHWLPKESWWPFSFLWRHLIQTSLMLWENRAASATYLAVANASD